MTALGELAQMLVDDAVVRWHRWRRDVHDQALAAACARRAARIRAWTGRL